MNFLGSISKAAKGSMLVVVLLVVRNFTLAQSIQVLDATTLNPVPFCTGQLEGDHSGFVSDEFGRLRFQGQIGPDAIISIRSIGYITSIRNYISVSNKDTILLRPASMVLSMVTIRPETPEYMIKRALRKVPENYAQDSFMTKHYYRETITEDISILHHAEAFIEAIQPPYLADQDSADIRIIAGRKSDNEALHFMQKERDKMEKKEKKKASKKGEALSEEELDWSLELGNPHLMLRIDPLRHTDVPFTINDDNVGFLDSMNFSSYQFWYGKPTYDGERTYTVIHFDQNEDIKKPLMHGTLWIEDSSSAFVKISFGFSEKGLKYLLPGYMKAALWVYGLSYQVHATKIEFDYRATDKSWIQHSARIDADFTFERRRFFNENDVSNFKLRLEMLTIQLRDSNQKFESNQLYDFKKPLSKQLMPVSDAKWNELNGMRRRYY